MATLQEQYDDAMFAFAQANYDEAIEQLSSILQKDPEHFDARLALGMSHYRLGDYARRLRRGTRPSS